MKETRAASSQKCSGWDPSVTRASSEGGFVMRVPQKDKCEGFVMFSTVFPQPSDDDTVSLHSQVSESTREQTLRNDNQLLGNKPELHKGKILHPGGFGEEVHTS